MDQCRRFEMREKARNVFFCDEPASVCSQGITQHRIFIKFFSVSLGFSRFFRSNLVLQIYLNNYSTRACWIWLVTISYPTRAHGIIVKYSITLTDKQMCAQTFWALTLYSFTSKYTVMTSTNKQLHLLFLLLLLLLLLSSSLFRDAVKLRYDWDVPDMRSICVCGDHFNVDHGMICKRMVFSSNAIMNWGICRRKCFTWCAMALKLNQF